MSVCRTCLTESENDARYCAVCGSSLALQLVADAPRVAVLSPTADLLAGRYRMVEHLGEGGFGDTFVVDDVALERRAVMKVMRESDATPATLDRLRREFALVSRIEHPAIARNYDVGQLADGRPYLVTEWVRGSTLDTVLSARKRLPVSDAIDVALALAGGLARAHDAGLLHRDVKPQNIMIPGGNEAPVFAQAKLVDFGAFGELLVRPDSDQRFTQAGMFFGTPRYMSPEQIQALPQSPATDVYGLALVLAEMIYGDVPLTERGRTSGQSVLLRILKEEISLAPNAEVPDALRSLIERSLSKDPAARPRDGAAFARSLQLVYSGMSGRVTLGAPAAGMAGPVAQTTAPTPAMASYATTSAMPRATGAAPYVGVAVAVIAAVGIGAVLIPASARQTTLHVLPWIAGGLALAAGGVVGGRTVRRIAHSRMHEVEVDAERLLLGLRTRRALSDTLQIEVTRIIARCRDLDERLLGITIMKMIHEYDAANESNERQAALMNVATLLEKLRGRLSPWYARFEKQLALTTSVLGIATGAITVIAGIMKLAHKQP